MTRQNRRLLNTWEDVQSQALIRKMPIKAKLRYLKKKKSRLAKSKVWQACFVSEAVNPQASHTSRWECKLVEAAMEAICQYLANLEIYVLSTSQFPLDVNST